MFIRIFLEMRNLLPIVGLFLLLGMSSSLKGQGVDPSKDLPLERSGSKGKQDVLILYLSGDGCWNSFNQQMSQALEKRGYGIVALNSRKYFWNEKSPEEFAKDFEHVALYYMSKCEKPTVIVVGYSFGADVAGFLPSRLSAALHKKVKKVVLVSPSSSTDFVVRLSDLIGDNDNPTRKYKVGSEITRSDIPIVCTFGSDEEKILHGLLQNSKILTIFNLPGDHQYNNDFDLLLKTIGL